MFVNLVPFQPTQLLNSVTDVSLLLFLIWFLQEDIPRQLYYICLYVVHITGAYVLKWVLLYFVWTPDVFSLFQVMLLDYQMDSCSGFFYETFTGNLETISSVSRLFHRQL